MDPVTDPAKESLNGPCNGPCNRILQRTSNRVLTETPMNTLPKDSKFSIGLHNSLPQLPNLATIPLTYLLTHFFPKIKDLNNLDLLSI